jgi:hypothetical protein
MYYRAARTQEIFAVFFLAASKATSVATKFDSITIWTFNFTISTSAYAKYDHVNIEWSQNTPYAVKG